MINCPNCNMQLPDDSDFCQYCGAKIVSASTISNKAVEADSAMVFTNVNSNKPQSQAEEGPNQPLIEKKEEINGLVANNSEKTPETKTKKKSVWARIGVAAIMLALIGLNVFQYMNSQNKIADVSSLKGKIEDLEGAKLNLDEEVDELKSQVSSLEQELESTKKDNTSLNSTITSLKSQITTLTNEKNSLQTRNTALANENANAKNAVNAYNAMRSFYSGFNDDYYSTSSIVVVKVGYKETFDIFSTINGTLYVQGSNDNSDIEWGPWYYNMCLLTVTGKVEGTTTYTFTNTANNHQFKVLVVTIPR